MHSLLNNQIVNIPVCTNISMNQSYYQLPNGLTKLSFQTSIQLRKHSKTYKFIAKKRHDCSLHKNNAFVNLLHSIVLTQRAQIIAILDLKIQMSSQ